MGRKAIEKRRKPLTHKAAKWVRELIRSLQDKDLESLTMDDLAQLAGKSKSTIYIYFSSKEEVYLTGVKLILDDLEPVGSANALKGEDMEVALREILVGIGEGIEGISIHFLEQLRANHPEIWTVVMGFANKVLENLATIYKKGMEDGSFRQFNTGLLTELDSYFVMSVMTDTEKISKHGMSLNDLVTEYLELRISALGKT